MCFKDIFHMPKSIWSCVLTRAQCRTRLLPAAKLTHNQMKSAEARSRQSSLPLLPLPIPQMMHILISRHLLMQNEIEIIPIKENLQATVLQPLTSARGCQHTSQADPRLRGGKVTSRETFGLANAHLVACIQLQTSTTMKILHAEHCFTWNMVEFTSRQKSALYFRNFASLCSTLGWQTGHRRRRRIEGRGVALGHHLSGLGGPWPHRSSFNPFHQSDYVW